MTKAVQNNRWRAMLFCIGSAVVFWSLNALNKDYTTALNYPVRFTINEKKTIFKEKPPRYIPLEVKGKGWILLWRSLRINTPPIALPVAKVARRGRVIHTRLYTLLTQQIKDLQINKILVNKLRIHTAPKPANHKHTA